MTIRIALAVAAACIALAAPTAASAYDLTGAWANDVASCAKIFAKKGGAFDFKPGSDVYGSGFIVVGDRIRGRFARCRITTKKEDGTAINLLAACSTDIMLSNVQFSLKVVDDNRVRRLFPGMEGLELQYTRCP